MKEKGKEQSDCAFILVGRRKIQRGKHVHHEEKKDSFVMFLLETFEKKTFLRPSHVDHAQVWPRELLRHAQINSNK